MLYQDKLNTHWKESVDTSYLVNPPHKSSDFVRFWQTLNEKYPAGDKVHLILANHSAHTSREAQEYLNITRMV